MLFCYWFICFRFVVVNVLFAVVVVVFFWGGGGISNEKESDLFTANAL